MMSFKKGMFTILSITAITGSYSNELSAKINFIKNSHNRRSIDAKTAIKIAVYTGAAFGSWYTLRQFRCSKKAADLAFVGVTMLGAGDITNYLPLQHLGICTLLAILAGITAHQQDFQDATKSAPIIGTFAEDNPIIEALEAIGFYNLYRCILRKMAKYIPYLPKEQRKMLQD